MGQATTTLYRQTAYLFPVMLVLVVLGFLRTYFTVLPSTRVTLHIHGLLMLAWMGALIAQGVLVRTGRMTWHRRAGKASYVIAPLIVLFGFVVMREFLGGPGSEHSQQDLQTLTVPLFAILQFGLTYALAIYYRRDTPLHARYMISTGLILMSAGTIRIFQDWVLGISSFPMAANANFIFLEVLTVGLILNDLRLGRIRAPFVLTLALFVSNHVLLWTAADMGWWQTLARWIGG